MESVLGSWRSAWGCSFPGCGDTAGEGWADPSRISRGCPMPSLTYAGLCPRLEKGQEWGSFCWGLLRDL